MTDEVHGGQVTILLDGDEVTLVPSGRALLALSRKHNGIVGLSAALQRMEIDAFVDVIAASVPGITAEQREALPDLIFASGPVNLAGPLGDFLGYLANGGRKPGAAKGGDEVGNL